MHDYRLRSGPLRLGRIGRRLDRLDEVLDACRVGTELLLSTRWARPVGRGGDGSVPDGKGPRPGSSPGTRHGFPPFVQPLFRVPLFVADRDAAIAALARRGIVVGYLYDPPLDDYAGAAFTDPSPDPAGARWFARHALPVDPLRARQVVEVLQESGVRPAEAPGGLEPTRG
jgi:hypothetical protein